MCTDCLPSDDKPVFHVDHTIGFECESVVVCYDDECFAGCVAQVKEKFVELFAVVAVEAACRFVGKYDLGVVDECACHGGALAFASRQL